MNQVTRSDPRVSTVRNLIEQLKPQMAAALPAHLSADRMARIVMTQVQNNPKLLDCDKGSLLAAVMTSAQLGLEPDGILGHGYLVPYGSKCQFIPGYRGYIKLARQSGEVSDFYAMEVRTNDTFKIVDGLNRDLKHVRATGDRGELVGFYAVAKYLNGGFDFQYMTVAEINEVRDNAQGYKAFKAGKIKETPWDSSYVPMALKTVIRKIAKYLPMSVQKAAALEDNYEAGKATIIEGDSVVVTEAIEEASSKEAQAPAAAAATDKLDQFSGKEAPAKTEKPAEAKKDAKPAKDAKKPAAQEKAPEGFPPQPGTQESVDQGYEAPKPEPEFED